ncbi:MAG: 2-oxoacid:acceptor oxidoreductase subunit alpha [Anaerolineae bacterium]|nr:2-oxoacid:acceptor oxidoreductase subunit alpha [Anaerolineae bacterium]
MLSPSLSEEVSVRKQEQELDWRVGGPQGSGVDTAAGIFARACAIGGLYLFGRREYFSNIKGRHSYYDVRVSHRVVTSHRDTVDLLTTFEAESLIRHALAVVPSGAIIYNANDADVALDRIVFLDSRLREDLTTYLAERDLPPTTAGLLEDAHRRNVLTYAVPYAEISSALAEKLGIPKATASRTLNTVAVAISTALLDYDPQYLVKALEKIFSGRERIINMNIEAVNLAYQFVHAEFDTHEFGFRLTPEKTSERRLLINGHQAVAMGKLAGGMSFQSYYPISPATDESVFLEAHPTFPSRTEGRGLTVVVQTEDELSALAMASGAALTGARSATATSGPGFSLMAEGLGWAGMNEVPVVITLYQRGGPSTGMPTRSEQGDLLFAIFGGHGESPRIVIASGDLMEAFYDAAQAFNYAERYQMPVIHLVDKAMTSMMQVVPVFDLESIKLDRGERYTPTSDQDNGRSPRFAITESGISPRPFLGQPGGKYWMTGVEHTEYGRVTEDPVIREQMMEKRARKLELALREIPPEEKIRIYGYPGSPFTIMSWGSNKGGILDALERLHEDGITARLIQVRLLWPFPVDVIQPQLEQADPLVVVESNYSGQFAALLRQNTGRAADYLVVKYSGRPMSGQALYQAFKAIHKGTSPSRVVLRNPYE